MYDVCVVGAGPAGLMAAGAAAEQGARVVLLEKNRAPGKKLLITGGGRCNVTNAEPDPHRLVGRYGAKAQELYSVFARYPADAMRQFLANHGVPTKVEDENRVFPSTDRAASIRDALMDYIRDGDVTLLTRTAATGIEPPADGSNGDWLVAGNRAKALILATGGISRPETGSTGDGFRWLEQLGHTVRIPEPSLVPMRVREEWIEALQGVSLADAGLSVWLDGSRVASRRGKLLFTHFGLSGPLALNMAQTVSETAQGGPVSLAVDLLPDIDGGEVDRQIQALIQESPKQQFRNALGRLVPPRVARAALRLAGVEAEQPCHSVGKDARKRAGQTIKALRLTFDGLLGTDRAVVSSGGVDPREIDFTTMQSRIVSGLYVAGDLLDFDRQSGGYSLQLCWATGYVAGTAAASQTRSSE